MHLLVGENANDREELGRQDLIVAVELGRSVPEIVRDLKHSHDCTRHQALEILLATLVRLHASFVVAHVTLDQEGPSVSLSLDVSLDIESVAQLNDHGGQLQEVKED